MKSHVRRGLALCSFLSMFLFLAVASLYAITPGRARGDLSFSNGGAPPVSTRLAAAPPVADPGQSVTATRPGEPNAVAAAGSYTAGSLPLVATYDLAANVEGSSTPYLIEGSVTFSDAAQYRFGSRFTPPGNVCNIAAGTTAATACSVIECGAVPRVRLQFVGQQEDLDALEQSEPVLCTVNAFVPEPGDLRFQASRPMPPDTVARLRGGNAPFNPILVRGDAGASLSATCAAKPKPHVAGQPRFVVDPDTGLVPLVGSPRVPPSLNCGFSGEVVIEVRVERQAGVLKGLFDISGEDEFFGRVSVSQFAGLDVPGVGATRQPNPNQPWVFEGIPPRTDDWEVSARALVDERRIRLELPHLDGANGRVEMAPGQTVDLRATFVVRPRAVRGTIRLFDEVGLTQLNTFRTGQFVSRGDNDTTFMRARGDSTTIERSGHQAFGDGVVNGTYNAITHGANLDYRLFVAGLNTPEGALDGTTTLNVPWRMDSLNIFFRAAANAPKRHASILLLDHEPIESKWDEPPVQIDHGAICFAELEMNLVVAEGRFYAPILRARETTPNLPGNPPSYRLFSADAEGEPRQKAAAAREATVSLTVPAGLRYPLFTSITFIQPNGQESPLNDIALGTRPPVGRLECGARERDCGVIVVDGNGQSTLNTLAVSASAACSTTGTVDVSVNVDSEGRPVREVSFRITAANAGLPDICGADGQNMPVCGTCPGCTPCQPNAALTIPNITVPPGGGVIHIFAKETGNECCASYSLPIESTPQRTLTCPNSITVFLRPGETTVSTSDPRIAEQLNPRMSGGCAPAPTLIENLPDFCVEGQTCQARYSAGTLSCVTNIVLQRTAAELAYLDDNVLTAVRLADNHTLFRKTLTQPVDLEYDATGALIAAIEPTRVTIRDSQTGEDALGVVFPGTFTSVKFRPTNNKDIAFLRPPAAATGSWTVTVVFQNAPTATETINLSQPGVLASSARMAWSPDGRHLSVIFAARRNVDPQMRVVQFDMTGNVFAGRTDSAFPLLPRDTSEEGSFVDEAIRDFAFIRNPGGAGPSAIAITNRRLVPVPPTTSFLQRRISVGAIDGGLFAFINQPRVQGTFAPDEFLTVGSEELLDGPTVGRFVKSVAVSRKLRLIAVAQQTDIRIYQILTGGGITEVHSIPDRSVLRMRFRPVP